MNLERWKPSRGVSAAAQSLGSPHPRDIGITQVGNEDAEFIALLDAFRSTGGIERAEHVALQMHATGICNRLTFDQWMVDGRLLNIDWCGSTWLPLFQFQSRGRDIHPGLEPILSALRPFMSRWELAQWFAEPNAWLEERRPAEVLASDSLAVEQAACAARFIISG
jgi:hypothetical protein